MIVQPFSDIHLDFPGSRGFPPAAPGVGLVLIAGDICQGLVRAVEQARDAYPRIEIAMVAGNHEFYGRVYGEELEAGRRRALALGVKLLENDTAFFGPLRVLGATLWTDYDAYGANLREPAMRTAAETMLDHKKIRWRKDPWQRFRPQEARSLHLRSRVFLEAELAQPHQGYTLLLSHHPGVVEAVEPLYRRSLNSAAFWSEMTPLIDRHAIDWWVSGHTHFSMDIRRGLARLISNPAGYAGENRHFSPAMTIEVPDR